MTVRTIRRLVVPLIGALASGCADSRRSGDGAELEDTVAPADTLTYRAILYGDEFRARFDLPASGVENLDPGLMAVALEVTPSGFNSLDCRVRLYVDDELEIAYPNPLRGAWGNFDSGIGALFFVGELADPDYEYVEAELAHYANRLLFRSREVDFERGIGSWQTVPYESFDTRLLPGLATLSFTIFCVNLDPALGSAEVWVLRSGAGDYEIDYTTFDPEHLYRFRIPERLQTGAWPRFAAADTFNLQHEPDFPRRGQRPSFDIP